MSAYDLILQGGTLYNPCAGTMELCDLAIKDGKIAAHGKNLNAADAETVMDVTGLIVSPGLIDMHCHVYPVFPYQMPDSLRTINAEEYMFRAGVTTAVDAGTTGWRNFGDFKENVIDATKVRVLAFIDMPPRGCTIPRQSRLWLTSTPKSPPPLPTPGRMSLSASRVPTIGRSTRMLTTPSGLPLTALSRQLP